MGAAQRWREGLASLAIPHAILAAAPETPWGFPIAVFASRAERAGGRTTLSQRRAREVLPEGGSVLDVGSGAGAASLPLAPPAGRIDAVDRSEDLLAAFARIAGERGIAHGEIRGAWPDVADRAPAADVVVCDHVLYDVPDLTPFVEALGSHARRRVVVTISAHHPLAWTRDLWVRFHGIDRPAGPDAADALDVIRSSFPDAIREDEEREPSGGFPARADAIALARRRLCLGADRDDEVADALGPSLALRDGLWSIGPARQVVATIRWDRGRGSD